MNVDDELRAWARMLHRVPPSVRADPDLYRAYVLKAGRRISGVEVSRAATTAPLRERTVAISGGTGYVTYVLAGLGVSVVVLAGVLLWRRLSRSREVVGLDVYLVGVDVSCGSDSG